MTHAAQLAIAAWAGGFSVMVFDAILQGEDCPDWYRPIWWLTALAWPLTLPLAAGIATYQHWRKR